MVNPVTRAILKHNEGRDPRGLSIKFKLLRRDSFAFFRGTNHLFLRHLARSDAAFKAPHLWVCGDLHLENFGTYKGDNRLCYFDINDFDEACLAPAGLDIVRFLTSIHAAAPVLKLDRAECDILVNSFLSGYREAVLAGKPRWAERAIADGAIRLLLRGAMRRTRMQLLERYTRLRNRRRTLRLDDARLFGIRPAQSRALRGFCKGLRDTAASASFFDLRDAAYRIAGNASLGSPRYALLVRGRGSPNGNFILDLKRADASVAARWVRRRQRDWANEAERIANIQALLQAIAPALLHATQFAGEGYVLKELQPSLDRLDLAQLSTRVRRMRKVLEQMGRITAWAHLRGCGRWGAASVEELQHHVQSARWGLPAQRLALRTARALHRDWKAFCADYDAGRAVY